MGFFDDIAESIGDYGEELLDIPKDPAGTIDNWYHNPAEYYEFVHPGSEELKDKLFPPLPIIDPITGVLTNATGSALKIPIVYGEKKVGGIKVFIGVSGTVNEFLHMVLVLSEGEIESIGDVFLDDVISTDDKFSGLLDITKYTGTTTQAADPTLVAAFPDWTTAHQLKGVAYLSIRMEWDEQAYGGLPTVSAVIKGKKVYDTRTTTTAWSHNPALCVADYLLDPIYGKGLILADLNVASFDDAADFCETQVEMYTGSDDYDLFACNGLINTDQTIKDNLVLLLSSCRGTLIFTGGLYSLKIEKADTAVFDFNTDNIIGGWSFTGASSRTKLNEVKVTFVDLVNWEPNTVVEASSTYKTEDNDVILSRELQLPMESDVYRARHRGETALKSSREGILVTFAATPAAFQVECGEVVTVTHPTPGWSAKTFRVMNLKLQANGLVGVSLREHEDSSYDRTVSVEATPPPNTNLPNPFSIAAPTSLLLNSGDEHLKIANDGTIISRINVNFTAPTDAFVIGYILGFKLTSDTDWTYVDIGNLTTAYISPVKDGVEYNVRVQAYNIAGIKSTWLEGDHTVIGKLAPPPDVTTLLVARDTDGTRIFSWTMNSPPADLAGYKIRYKLSTGHVWEDMSELHDGLLLSSPFETNALAAGTYTVAIKAFDTTGNESANEVIIQSTLGDPRIAGSIYTYSSFTNGWLGTKTSCFVDPSDGLLWADGTDAWSDLPATWTGWTKWEMNPASPFSYENDTIDLGAILEFTPYITVSGIGSFVVEEQHSSTTDDPGEYSSWAEIGVGVISARYINLRVTVTSASEHGYLSEMFINLASTPVEETINNLDTSTLGACTPSPSCSTSGFKIAAGDFRVPVVNSYTTITQIGVALQNVGAGWSWEVIDKDTAVGPRIKIYNGSGTLADANIDVHVKGV